MERAAQIAWEMEQLSVASAIRLEVKTKTPAGAPDTAALTRAFMEETFDADSDDTDSRMEKYGVAFAAIEYALSHSAGVQDGKQPGK